MVTGTIHFYLGAIRIAQLIQTRGLTIGLDLGDRASYYCVLDEGE
jgi:hypothetical protein